MVRKNSVKISEEANLECFFHHSIGHGIIHSAKIELLSAMSQSRTQPRPLPPPPPLVNTTITGESFSRPWTKRRRGIRVAGWQFGTSPSILSNAGAGEVLGQSKQAGLQSIQSVQIKQSGQHRKHASSSTGHRHGRRQRLVQPSPPAP